MRNPEPPSARRACGRASLVRALARVHAALFRRFRGSPWKPERTLLLTTVGRKSGRQGATPLFFVAEGERLYVVASFGGSDAPPGWYRNLEANPEAEVERRATRRRYRARTLSREESVALWPKLLAIRPAYASDQKRTRRRIPIVELTPSD
jgi:deazaflavin-dependent oxidoreductase (nitroreductase family)